MLTGKYGLQPLEIADLTLLQVQMYLDGAQLLDYSQHLPTAAWMAMYGNSQGGKNQKGKPIPKANLFTPNEFLVAWGIVPPQNEQPEKVLEPITPELARLIVQARADGHFFSWAVAPFGGYQKVLETAGG